MKLIRSSIYKVNGTLARFTGEYRDNSGAMNAGSPLPVFSAHGSQIIGGTVEKVSSDEVRAYLGR